MKTKLIRTISILFVCIYCNSVSAQSSEPAALTSPESAEELHRVLQGKWKEVAWKTDKPESEYTEKYNDTYSIVHKIYTEKSFIVYDVSAEGVMAYMYGGSYEVVDKHTVLEKIEFYGPFKAKRPYYGTDGNITIIEGKTMVGSQIEFALNVDKGLLYLSGIHVQNTSGENAGYYRPLYRNNGYKKVE